MVIYKITNTFNNKVYIGQTVCSDPYQRVRAHFKKSKDIDLVYKSYKKYGKESFKWEVIYTAFDLDELNRAERYFISYYNSLRPNGYNIQLGGSGSGKFSEETKNKVSIRIREWYKENEHPFKGKKFTKEHCDNLSRTRKGFTSPARIKARKESSKKQMIPIIAINLKTNEETEFCSIKECADFLNMNPTNISRVLRRDQNRFQHKGYDFKYKSKENNQLPQKINPLKYITSINKGGYSVTARGKYLGWRKNIGEAIELRDSYLKTLDKSETEELE